MSFVIPVFVVAGLRDSILGSFGAFLMVLIGVAGLMVGVFAVVQTTRWPANKKSKTKAKATPLAVVAPPPPASAPKRDPPPRAATTTNLVRIRFPAIEERHPDVWDRSPLDVLVRVETQRAPGAAQVRVHTTAGGVRREAGRTPVDAEGRARLTVRPDRLGDCDVIAELWIDDQPAGQAVRPVRVVDYRAEIVETFEDFVAWAASQFTFADARMTAREFVDRFADARAGTPTTPLEAIADLYEVANYSEHPVDRASYLRLVDAFLQLEDAGALEGPGAQ